MHKCERLHEGPRIGKSESEVEMPPENPTAYLYSTL